MSRFFMELSFKGTNYHGWQSQPNASSVQSEIEKAMQTILHEDIKTTGAGRTDTGVHARFYVAHFDTDHILPLKRNDFLYKMNAVLPPEIAVSNVYPVKPESHARFSAISRTYNYYISKVKDPFLPEFSWYYSLPLDIAIMNEASAILLEYDDFTSFSKLHSDVNNNLCKVFEAGWSRNENQLIFTIRANRFLRNMMRSIVGTMIDIGKGKTSLEAFRMIIEGKDRSLAGFSVPSQGLILAHIVYTNDIIL